MTSRAISSLSVRRASVEDAALLSSLAEATFRDTFAAENTADDMALYTGSAFGEAIQRAELEDPLNTVFFADGDGEAVGYVMLREGGVPACVPSSDAIEIARLYALRRWIGAGIGAALIQHCLDEAALRGRHTIWLGVWERNARAIAFYQRWGFRDVGTQLFRLGHDEQTDRVMARAVVSGT